MNNDFCLMVADHLKSQDAKEERAHVRLWVGRVLVLVAILLTTAYTTGAYAAPLFKGMNEQGPVSLRLLEEPCTNPKVLAALKERVYPQLIPEFKAGVLFFAGKGWATCWIEREGHVFSIDEEGAPFQPVPRAAFREDTV